MGLGESFKSLLRRKRPDSVLHILFGDDPMEAVKNIHSLEGRKRRYFWERLDATMELLKTLKHWLREGENYNRHAADALEQLRLALRIQDTMFRKAFRGEDTAPEANKVQRNLVKMLEDNALGRNLLLELARKSFKSLESACPKRADERDFAEHFGKPMETEIRQALKGVVFPDKQAMYERHIKQFVAAWVNSFFELSRRRAYDKFLAMARSRETKDIVKDATGFLVNWTSALGYWLPAYPKDLEFPKLFKWE